MKKLLKQQIKIKVRKVKTSIIYNYNEQINSDYDSSDDNYVATVENVSSPQVALKNITITIGNTDCDLLLDSGSGCTIINMSLAREIMYKCPQSQWSEKNH